MKYKNKIFICLVIIFILLICFGCSKNSNLTDEQKTPEYAIEQYLKIDYGEYKYVVLGNYLFVSTAKEVLTAFKTDIGNYSFEFPFFSPRSILKVSEGGFYSTIGMAKVNQQYEIDVLVLPVANGGISTQPYSVFDSMGEKLTSLQYSEDQGSIWWIKVMDNIPEDYKIFIEAEDGTICEVLNKETIDKKLK